MKPHRIRGMLVTMVPARDSIQAALVQEIEQVLYRPREVMDVERVVC
jgi:hypothetical protein